MPSDLLADLGIVCPDCEALNEPAATVCCACGRAVRTPRDADVAADKASLLAFAATEPPVVAFEEPAPAPPHLQAASPRPAPALAPPPARAATPAPIASTPTPVAVTAPGAAAAAAAAAAAPSTATTAPGIAPGVRPTPPPLTKSAHRPAIGPHPTPPVLTRPPPPPPAPPTLVAPAPAPKPSAPPPSARPRAIPPVPAPAAKQASPAGAAGRAHPTPAPRPGFAPSAPPVLQRVAPSAAAPRASSGSPSPIPTPAPIAGPAVARDLAERVRLVVVRGAHAGTVFRVGATPAAAGRSEGVILLPEDPYVSPMHATFSWRDGKLYVRDECSDSGTYVPLRDAQLIAPGATFVVGDHLLRFAGRLPSPTAAIPLAYGAPPPPGFAVRIEELLEGGRLGRVWVRPAGVISIGRTGSTIELADATVATRHCELQVQPEATTLRDLGSPEGTLVRMAPDTECTLSPGESLRLGGLLLRVEA